MNTVSIEPTPVTGPTIWRALDVDDPSTWTIALSHDEIDQLRNALARQTVASRHNEVKASGLPIIAKIESALRNGLGFVVVKGFPMDSDEEEALRFFLEFGRLLGRPEPQNRDGDLLSRVQSEESGRVRGARTNRALLYHTDFAGSVPRTLGLLAVREARDGGDSLVASGHTIHNALLTRAPEVVGRLYQPFYFDRTGYVASAEESVFRAPVFQRVGERLDVLYNRARLQRGHRMMSSPLEPEALEALNALDDLLASEENEYALKFTLAAGSALFAANRIMLHNRTAFIDHEESTRKRLLIRMWLDA